MSSSSFDETLTHSTCSLLQSCSTPANLVAEKSIHNYLLEPISRKQSPVTRTYFNKKVTFDENTSVAEEPWDEPLFSRLFQTDSVLPWQSLSKSDRCALEQACVRLASRKPNEIRLTCEDLAVEATEDFNPEIFIQRPDIMFHLQDILMSSENQSVKALVARVLSKISFKLREKIEFLSDLNQVSTKDNLSSSNRSGTFSDDEESFADHINTTQLMGRQILVHEFCLLCLSNSSATLSHLTENKALNGSIGLFFESLALLEVVLKSPSQTNWYENNRGVAKNAKDVLDEIARELSLSFKHHRKLSLSSEMSERRFHRVAYLCTLKASVEFLTTIGLQLRSKEMGLRSVIGLKHLLSDSLSDETLYLSHKSLHKQVYDLQDESRADDVEDQSSAREGVRLKMEKVTYKQFDQIKKIFKSLSQAVKMLNDDQRPPDRKAMLESCSEAIFSYSIYENPKIVKLSFAVCKTASKNHRPLVCKTILQALAFPDLQVKTSAYIELHSLVQAALGINRAVDVDGARISEIFFLLNDGVEILEEILQFGMISESKHIRQACEDILLYLLKSEKVLGEEIWNTFISHVLRPNLPLLECFASTNTSQKNDFSNDTRTFLGSFIIHAMSPEDERQMFNGITTADIVHANLRMFLSKEQDVRERALANLKSILSKEENSHDLLPRFSIIVQKDLTNYFKRFDVKVSTRSANLTIDDEQILLVRNLLEILTSESVDFTMKRAALLRLGVVLQNSVPLQNVMIGQNGLEVLYDVVRRCLSESNNDYPVDLLPALISIFKSIFLFQTLVRFDLAKIYPTAFLLSMLRCIFIFDQDSDVRDDIAIIFVKILFNKYLKVNENSSDALMLPLIFHEVKNIPLCCGVTEEVSRHEVGRILSETNNVWGYLGLIKTFWNFAWHGGPRNTLKHKDSITSKLYSEKLHMTKDDLSFVRFSFAEFVFEDLPEQLRSSGRHSLFIKKLHFASSHMILSKEQLNCESAHYFPLKETFGKYLTSRPMSFSDEKLFIEVIEFITNLFQKLQDEISWANYIYEKVTAHFGVCVHFLTRTTTQCGQEFMIKKGQEKVSELIIKLFKNSRVGVQKSMSKDILSLIVSSKPAVNLSILKVLASLLPVWRETNEAPILLSFVADEVEAVKGFKLETLEGSSKFMWLFGVLEILLEIHVEVEIVRTLLEFLKSFIQHRNPLLRLGSLKCLSIIAKKEQGAKVLVPQYVKSQENDLWLLLSGVIMDPTESSYVRSQALVVLKNLLDHSSELVWYGPVATEPVSKVVIVGESALSLFFRQIQFEDFLIDNFRTFATFHHIPIDDSEEDSIRPSHTTTSHSSIQLSHRPTGFFISMLLNFIEQVVSLDDRASRRIGDPVSTFPRLFEEHFSVVLSLSFDVSDPQSVEVISAYRNATEDYIEMFDSLSSLLQSALFLFEDRVLPNILANNAVYQSMLVSSTYHLWTIKKSQMPLGGIMHELAQLLSTKPSLPVLKMVAKFYDAIMTMVLSVLKESCSFDLEAQRATALVASLHRYILLAEENSKPEGTDSVLTNIVQFDTVASHVCEILVSMQFLHREDHLAVHLINVALQHLFLISTGSKNHALVARSHEGLHYLQFLIEEIDKLLDLLDVFASSTNKDEELVLSFWSDVDNFVNLANNLCIGSLAMKQAMASAEIHKTIVHIFALVLATGGQGCSQLLRNLLLVITCNTLSLTSTLAASCNESKFALIQSALPKLSSVPFQNASPKSILQTLIALYNEGKKDKENRCIFNGPGGTQRIFQLIVAPKLFRIVTGALTCNECRSYIIRSNFCSDFPDVLTSRSKNLTNTFRQSLVILVLDFLLTLTSFADGQMWLLKQKDLMDALQEILQSTDSSDANGFSRQNHLATLTIMRNVSFHPSGRVKLLLDTQFLGTISKLIGVKSSETIVLSMIWSLASNNHRAKISLQDSGITRRILEELHKQEGKAQRESPDNKDLLKLVKKILSFEQQLTT